MIKLIKILIFLFISTNLLFLQVEKSNEKIKIGLLVPMSGTKKSIGRTIIKAVSLAEKDIDSNRIEINHKDKDKEPNQTQK